MYVRTKDKIYKLFESPLNDDDDFVYVAPNGCISETDIINQSENLEELCDEFVGIDNTCENGHQLLRAIPYKCVNFWNGGVYGAIWTKKGLIFIAKMNDKGELELL